MKNQFLKSLFVIPLLMFSVAISMAAKAAAVDAELSRVTIFVEGMMKSQSGVT